MQEYRTYQQDDDLTKYGNKVNEKEIINPEFYNYVMDDVDESLTGVALAYEIYSSLIEKYPMMNILLPLEVNMIF